MHSPNRFRSMGLRIHGSRNPPGEYRSFILFRRRWEVRLSHAWAVLCKLTSSPLLDLSPSLFQKHCESTFLALQRELDLAESGASSSVGKRRSEDASLVSTPVDEMDIAGTNKRNKTSHDPQIASDSSSSASRIDRDGSVSPNVVFSRSVSHVSPVGVVAQLL